MGLIGLWAMAIALLVSAVVFGWVTISTHPIGSRLTHRGRQIRRDELVRRACADLDDEYRQLLNH